MRFAASRTFCTAGNNKPISTAMIAITTSSSMRVKPLRARETCLLMRVLLAGRRMSDKWRAEDRDWRAESRKAPGLHALLTTHQEEKTGTQSRIEAKSGEARTRDQGPLAGAKR